VVLVGNRQKGREHDRHVTPVSVETNVIKAAIRRQLTHGRYAPSALYGDGKVARRIADALANLQPYTQKKLHYICQA
jgi:hypothetical protein